jgi:hypothetical protein
MTDVSVVEYPLDLRATPADLLAQVSRLAESAWSTLEARLRPAS